MEKHLNIAQIVKIIADMLNVSTYYDAIELKNPREGYYVRNGYALDGSPAAIKVSSPDGELVNVRVTIPDKRIRFAFQLSTDDVTEDSLSQQFESLAKLCNSLVSEPVVEYFYTERHPHRWGGAPVIMTLDKDNGYEPILSLERAKEIAEQLRVRSYDEDCCETTYGIQYKVK